LVAGSSITRRARRRHGRRDRSADALALAIAEWIVAPTQLRARVVARRRCPRQQPVEVRGFLGPKISDISGTRRIRESVFLDVPFYRTRPLTHIHRVLVAKH
jgi:hypothetical protein